MKKWWTYLFILTFSTYWLSNLLLWFPWSYSTGLGITLMLTVSPVIWAYVTYLALQTYPKTNIYKAATSIAIVFLLIAAVFDYLFFGIFRQAMEDLYHPTTFYGYAFLVIWPLILAYVLKSKLASRKKKLETKAMIQALIIGLLCFSTLTLVILFE